MKVEWDLADDLALAILQGSMAAPWRPPSEPAAAIARALGVEPNDLISFDIRGSFEGVAVELVFVPSGNRQVAPTIERFRLVPKEEEDTDGAKRFRGAETEAKDRAMLAGLLVETGAVGQ